MRRSTLSLLAILLATISGCGIGKSTEPSVVFRSLDHQRSYSQKFSQAAFAPTDSGQSQVVLIDRGIDAPVAEPGKPLKPSTTPPLKQIITIRVLWRPARAAKPGDPVSNNAVIDWYIIGEESPGVTDLLHYQGTGFVQVAPKGDWATVEIRDSTLQLMQRAGTLEDPLGRTRLDASLIARQDDALVASTFAELQQQFAPRATKNQGPPPRTPTGP